MYMFISFLFLALIYGQLYSASCEPVHRNARRLLLCVGGGWEFKDRV